MRKDGFITHKVGEWIVPKTRGYQFKCCGCQLVHQMDFDMATDSRGNQSVIFRVTGAWKGWKK
jgi:hypothetical protein